MGTHPIAITYANNDSEVHLPALSIQGLKILPAFRVERVGNQNHKARNPPDRNQ